MTDFKAPPAVTGETLCRVAINAVPTPGASGASVVQPDMDGHIRSTEHE